MGLRRGEGRLPGVQGFSRRRRGGAGGGLGLRGLAPGAPAGCVPDDGAALDAGCAGAEYAGEGAAGGGISAGGAGFEARGREMGAADHRAGPGRGGTVCDWPSGGCEGCGGEEATGVYQEVR